MTDAHVVILRTAVGRTVVWKAYGI